MLFYSGIQIFSRIHVLVFRSVQLILSIRRRTHISKAVTNFSPHFFGAQLSDPYNAVLHISDRTSCLFGSMPMSFALQIPISCTCLALLWVLLLYLLYCWCQPWPTTPSIWTCSLFLFLCHVSTHFGFQYHHHHHHHHLMIILAGSMTIIGLHVFAEFISSPNKRLIFCNSAGVAILLEMWQAVWYHQRSANFILHDHLRYIFLDF